MCVCVYVCMWMCVYTGHAGGGGAVGVSSASRRPACPH